VREAKQRANAKWLAQGTIYPDVIESAGAKTGKAVTIKYSAPSVNLLLQVPTIRFDKSPASLTMRNLWPGSVANVWQT
jgi:hypothetical protein